MNNGFSGLEENPDVLTGKYVFAEACHGVVSGVLHHKKEREIYVYIKWGRSHPHGSPDGLIITRACFVTWSTREMLKVRTPDLDEACYFFSDTCALWLEDRDAPMKARICSRCEYSPSESSDLLPDECPQCQRKMIHEERTTELASPK